MRFHGCLVPDATFSSRAFLLPGDGFIFLFLSLFSSRCKRTMDVYDVNAIFDGTIMVSLSTFERSLCSSDWFQQRGGLCLDSETMAVLREWE